MMTCPELLRAGKKTNHWRNLVAAAALVTSPSRYQDHSIKGWIRMVNIVPEMNLKGLEGGDALDSQHLRVSLQRYTCLCAEFL